MNESDYKKISVIFAVKEEAKYFKPPSQVNVLFSGIGNKNAEKCIQKIINSRCPDIVLTCGFAGALNPALNRGTIVFQSQKELTPLLRALGGVEAKFHCSNYVVCTSKDKADLFKTTAADAVEMESGIIYKVCLNQNIPCTIIRVISDTANEDLPLNFNEFITDKGKIKLSILFIVLLRTPTAVFNLIKFQKNIDFSARMLGEFLNQFLKHYCGK